METQAWKGAHFYYSLLQEASIRQNKNLGGTASWIKGEVP